MEEIFKLTPASEIVKYLDDLQSIKEKNILLKFIQENIIEVFKVFETRSLNIIYEVNSDDKRCIRIKNANDEKLVDEKVTMEFLITSLRESGYLVEELLIPAKRELTNSEKQSSSELVSIIVKLPEGDIQVSRPPNLVFEEYFSGVSNPNNHRRLSYDTTFSLKKLIDTGDIMDATQFVSELNIHNYNNGFDNVYLLIHSIISNNSYITRFLLNRGVFGKNHIEILINLAIEHDSECALEVLQAFAKKITKV